MHSFDVSIVIPVFNEEDNFPILYAQIKRIMDAGMRTYEIIFVNDGSTDGTESKITELYLRDREHIKAINFDKNYGKATALRAGFDLARGSILITMDGDGQDDPSEIPRFIKKIDDGYDLVSGWKYRRLDSLVKNQTSKIYNFVTSIASGIYLHDHNCGFKAYRRETAQSLPLYGSLHRFIPMLAKAHGYTSITEIKVHHRRRIHGASKYSMSRFIYGITGLVTALRISYHIKHKDADSLHPIHFSFKSILL